jgi:hypothetical protein
MFVFFQKVSQHQSEQRGIDETYRYILKEHQRDATHGRHPRTRALGNTNKYLSAQNFILTPIIRLEHLLIKKKACGGRQRCSRHARLCSMSDNGLVIVVVVV